MEGLSYVVILQAGVKQMNRLSLGLFHRGHTCF